MIPKKPLTLKKLKQNSNPHLTHTKNNHLNLLKFQIHTFNNQCHQ